MKIGVVGTIWLQIPPTAYGGTEDVIAKLVNGLARRGHEVTLFGPKNAGVESKVFPTVEVPLREQNIPWTDISYHLWHFAEAFDRAQEFDLLHVHLNREADFMSFPLAARSPKPVLFTLHGQLPTPEEYPERHRIMYKYRHLPFTSISNAQRRRLPELNYIKTVYNALEIADFPFNPTPESYYVWLGKIRPLKGTKEAIMAAKKARKKLFVMGTIEKADKEKFTYYEEEVKPLFDYKYIHWLGPANLERKVQYLSGAKAFLNPILWEEPFGLVMAEAQAVGTPVISFNRGAASEVIIDGKTGFLVDTVEQMVAKIKEIDTIDRMACRKHIETMFTVEKNIDGYLEAYKTTIANWHTYQANLAEK